MWAVPLVAGHVILALVMMSGTATSLGSIDTGLIIGLAYVLAARFRDIGWRAWIGPAILIGTMLVLPLLGFVIVAANHAGGQAVDWLSVYGLFSALVNFILLIVAGSMPGKPEPSADIAQVFE